MRKNPLIRRLIFFVLLLAGTGGAMYIYRIERALLDAGRLHDVDWHLLRAVALQETRMNPKARGAAGEIGLFQIMPNTAKHWSQRTERDLLTEDQLFRVTNNAEIAAWYLRQGLDRFKHRKDPLPFALAYYNAGPSRAERWEASLPDGVPFEQFIPFPTTRKYVQTILNTYRGD